MENQNCFSDENFSKVKDYIAFRILNSSSGKNFYIEYPPSQEPFDGIKRLPKYPENVYAIRFDAESNQIMFKNPTVEHTFQAKVGLIYKKTHTEKEYASAHDIFCHLVGLAGK